MNSESILTAVIITILGIASSFAVYFIIGALVGYHS